MVILKMVSIILLFIGSLINPTIIWEIVDIIICILAIINMYVLISMRREIIFDYKNSK